METGGIKNDMRPTRAARIQCPECDKQNPTNRLRCLYCDAELASDIAWPLTERLIHQVPEEWENGFNLIYAPPAKCSIRAAEFVSCFLAVEVSPEALASPALLPLARLRTSDEAETLAARLRKSGVRVKIAADEMLDSKEPPIRLRAITFAEGSARLVGFNDGRIFEASREDIGPIVVGSVFRTTLETTLNRRKGTEKKSSESETFADETLIDIYLKGCPTGFRITMRGFDFSCLGTEKAVTAAVNVSVLANRIRKFARRAAFIDDYDRRRRILDAVWGIEETRDSGGLRRTGLGRVGFTVAATQTNLNQFTKYSRLQAVLG